MDEDVDVIAGSVARTIRERLPVLAPEMTQHFLQVIPEFRRDDAAQELMVSSTVSNLHSIVDLLEHGIAGGDLAVPVAAAEYARRFARLDLSLEALLRAYRLGEHRFGRWVLAAVRERGDLDADRALRVTDHIGQRVNGYIDEVLEGLVDIYREEHRAWNARSGAVRASTVRAVLTSTELDLGAAEATLGASLRGWHRAAVLWRCGPATALDAVQVELGGLTGLTPLSVLAEPGCLWAWWSGTAAPAVAASSFDGLLGRHPDLHVALGTAAAGLDGFRSSHREAEQARRLVDRGRPATHRMVDFHDVALPALLAEHPQALRAWVGRTLGELARDDDGAERLRDTLRAYLAAGRGTAEAAQQLHLHRNSVTYRVRRAEELIGRPLSAARLDVEVALLVCHHLGTSVLHDGS